MIAQHPLEEAIVRWIEAAFWFVVGLLEVVAVGVAAWLVLAGVSTAARNVSVMLDERRERRHEREMRTRASRDAFLRQIRQVLNDSTER